MNDEVRVWFDLANSPHVHFCWPIIGELQRRGAKCLVTTRDFAQTVELCNLLGVPHTVIGRHGGASLGGKAANLLCRTWALMKFAREARPHVIVTHNSYAQLVAGRLLRLPSLTSMDYEHQPANHLAFRCATLVAVPRAFPDEILRRQGASARKVWKFDGLKEDVALSRFERTPGYAESLGLDTSKVIVVVRPPATLALYHRFENREVPALLELLGSTPGLEVVLLPRTGEQARELAASGYDSLVWKGGAVHGPELIAASDLVISAGGSMNREAAVLGTPAYSIFAGRPAAVDVDLAEAGRLHLIGRAEDLRTLKFVKKPLDCTGVGSVRGANLVRQFADAAIGLLR